MVIVNSGIVLDYYSEIGISGATVLVYTITGSPMVFASGTCSPLGTFILNIPDTTSKLIYIPIKNNSIGYSICLPPSQSDLVLYSRQTENVPNISGIGSTNLNPTTLKTSQKVNTLKTSPTHVYIATTGGLDILDINTFENVGSLYYDGGFTSLALSGSYVNHSPVLLGTTSSGVLQFIIPTEYTPSTNLASLLTTKWSLNSGTLLSNTVNCMDSSSSGSYIIGTNSGIDYYKFNGTRYYHSYSFELETDCCQISDYEDLYYSPRNSGVYVKYVPSGNWTVPDYRVVISGSGSNPFPLLTNLINDIDLTSISGGNSVFIASASGFIAYDENRSNLDSTASGTILIERYP